MSARLSSGQYVFLAALLATLSACQNGPTGDSGSVPKGNGTTTAQPAADPRDAEHPGNARIRAAETPTDAWVEAMPVSVVIGPDMVTGPANQERRVTVTLDRTFVPGQVFSVQYDVRDPQGAPAAEGFVVLPSSPRTFAPAGPRSTQFWFDIRTTKGAHGPGYTVKVRVGGGGSSRMSNNQFIARPS